MNLQSPETDCGIPCRKVQLQPVQLANAPQPVKSYEEHSMRADDHNSGSSYSLAGFLEQCRGLTASTVPCGTGPISFGECSECGAKRARRSSWALKSRMP